MKAITFVSHLVAFIRIKLVYNFFDYEVALIKNAVRVGWQ